MIGTLSETDLLKWVEHSLTNKINSLASGYQGQTLLYDNNEVKLVIKVPHGRGFIKYIHTSMLRHEYAAYTKLEGFAGIPKCYGMINNIYLVLEYIEGTSLRKRFPDDETVYYQKLFEDIEKMHSLGVAHNDLKRKDNLMISADNTPVMIDFGVALIYKKGFHPFNNSYYKLAKQFDYNAWAKQKYRNQLIKISDADRVYYKTTFIEKASKYIRRLYNR